MASSMHQTFSGDVKSLRKYQCEICLYASSRKYDVKKHQERMHKNAKNAISKIEPLCSFNMYQSNGGKFSTLVLYGPLGKDVINLNMI